MIHKAWCSIEDVPYYFLGSAIKFQGHTGEKSTILIQFDRVRLLGQSQLSNPSDLPCLRSSIKFQGHMGWKKIDDLDQIWARLLGRSQLSNPSDLPCSRSSVNFQGRTEQKIADFDPNWAFPDCNSRLNSLKALKWCTKLNVVKKRCPIVFQGHPSNFKVTQLKKSSILTQIGRFRTVSPVWNHRWLRNDAQSLK